MGSDTVLYIITNLRLNSITTTIPTIPLGIAARACTEQAAFEINLIIVLYKPTEPDSLMFDRRLPNIIYILVLTPKDKRLYFNNFLQNFLKISDCQAFSLFYGEKGSDHEGTLDILKRLKDFRQNFVKISDCGAVSWFNDEKESDHEGTRTLNLPIRSRTPYPLGRAARHVKA